MPVLRYISHSCRYSLTVRLLVLLLLVNSIASACTSDTASEEQKDMPKEREIALDPDTTSTRRSMVPATLSVLGNPFVANRSQSNNLETYFDQIDSDFTVDADPIENRHRSSITDTVYTIRFGKSMMEFYAPTQSGELHLQVADIQSSDITLRNNIRIGMSQAELMNRLKTLGQEVRINQTPGEVIVSNREGAPISLHFYLKSGKVNRIRYEGYVD